jgi:hypothetical protein
LTYDRQGSPFVERLSRVPGGGQFGDRYPGLRFASLRLVEHVEPVSTQDLDMSPVEDTQTVVTSPPYETDRSSGGERRSLCEAHNGG